MDIYQSRFSYKAMQKLSSNTEHEESNAYLT